MKIFLCNDADNCFSVKYGNPSSSLFGRIKIIICFSQVQLCFEIYAGSISFSLVYKKLRANVGLFFSNLFQLSNLNQ